MPARTARLTTATVLVTFALALAGCSFTTTPKPSDPEPVQSTPADPASPTPDGAGTAAPADVTIDSIIATFKDAGIIDDAKRQRLAVNGMATQGYKWTDAGGGYIELYYVDPATATPEILKNLQLAREQHYMQFGQYQIPVDDVRGQFMIRYATASDSQAVQAAWERATAGLT